MNQAHFHLVLNHLPIIFPFIGLLVMIIGLTFKSASIQRTSYFIYILGALFTIPAFATGEGAEETIEHLPGVTERLIKIHEEAAEIFAVCSYLLGSISLMGLWASWKQKYFANYIIYLVLAVTVVVLFFAKQTGTTGGEIRHPEIGKSSNINLGNKGEKDDD